MFKAIHVFCSLPDKRDARLWCCASWFVVFFVANLAAGGAQHVTVTVLEPGPERTVLQCRVQNFETQPVAVGSREFTRIQLGSESPTMEVGAPELPTVNRSIVIPNDAEMSIRVLDSQSYELTGVKVLPSKGSLLRTIDPHDVPYTLGGAYQQDADYPGTLARLRTPYILRDVRGVVVELYPFQYNPVRETLRVYTELTVEVVTVGPGRLNVLDPRPNGALTWQARQVYSHQFINYAAPQRASAANESGEMLIVVHDPWIGNVQPLAAHKQAQGIPTAVVGVSTIPGGNDSTSIKNYIQQVYDGGNLSWVLLVGDGGQIACPYSSGGAADPTYALLAGDDSYPDIFVGRFSAESAADVDTQVYRTLNHELAPAGGQDWFWKGTGIASAEGPGDDGEYDWQHIDNIRLDLLAGGYTVVDQIYDPGASAVQVSTALNTGRGIVNYCGHGSTTSWATTGFSNSHINNLVNTDMLPFITSVACVNGEFDGPTCFAEAWLRATHLGEPTGAVGIYASSVNQYWNEPMCAQDEIVDLLISQSYMSFGALCFMGSCRMIDEYGSSGVEMYETWHVFGDPSLQVVGPGFMLSATPHELDVCAPGDAVYEIEVGQIMGFSEAVTLSAAGVPSGAEVSFSINPVIPPGNSVLTVSGTGSVTPGTYAITVAGVAPSAMQEAGVELGVHDAPPGAADLIEPADGTAGVSLRPNFSWTAATQGAAYEFELAADYGFENMIETAGGLQEPAYALEGLLEPEATYYWRVTALNPCGPGDLSAVFGFTTRATLPVLLVDDDDNSPDVRAYYTDALDALGVEYDLWDTNHSDDEPDATTLAQYAAVVWFTGDSYGGACGPGATCEQELGSYLSSGGCLFISSQDYHYDRGLTPFMSYYLGVNSVADDVGQTSVTGQDPVFEGLGPCSLSYPFVNYSDQVSPGDASSGAGLAFSGDAGDAGVYKETRTYRTTFWGFPWESVDGAGDRLELLSAVLDWCMTSGFLPADLDGDGTVGAYDLALLLADWGFCGACSADLDSDGMVGAADLAMLLGSWT